LSLIPGEVPPELDHGRQFAAFLEHLTDGRGCRFVDAEHGASMGRASKSADIGPDPYVDGPLLARCFAAF
jgi:hypothetical protein